jgi:haloacetate dehalogenase
VRHRIPTSCGCVSAEILGRGPPVLLLHGFPQTGLMWRDIVSRLAERRTVVVADLPGYGASDCPPDEGDPERMSKRRMAAALVQAMAALGHERFAVVGHDRGGRVAYRMALDHSGTVARLAVLDIVPTGEAWRRADARLALAFWPFSLLAQPSPLPETVLTGSPEAVIDDALTNWGSPASVFPPDVRQAYVDAIRDPAHARAICDEYRAAATIDRRHDDADLAAEHRIACPTLVLWSASGGLAQWYDDVGGPLGVWKRWADDLSGAPIQGGHFFPEEAPGPTADRLGRFLDQG